MDELKPCPICGSKYVYYEIVKGRKHKALAVTCKICGTTGPKVEGRLISYMRPIPSKGIFTKLDHAICIHGNTAAELWNRRVTDG